MCDCVLDNLYKFTIRLEWNNGRLRVANLFISKASENYFKNCTLKT